MESEQPFWLQHVSKTLHERTTHSMEKNMLENIVVAKLIDPECNLSASLVV
jgi:hypothetical protein